MKNLYVWKIRIEGAGVEGVKKKEVVGMTMEVVGNARGKWREDKRVIGYYTVSLNKSQYNPYHHPIFST